MKINIKALSLTLGILAFLSIWLIGIWFNATGFGKPLIDLITSLYANLIKMNYNPLVPFASNFSSNLLALILLSLFAAVDGAIAGVLTGFVYNFFVSLEKK